MEGTNAGAGGGELPLPKFFFFIFSAPKFCCCCFVVFVFKQNSQRVKSIILGQLVCLFNAKGSRIRTNVARVAVLYVLASSGDHAIGMAGSA